MDRQLTADRGDALLAGTDEHYAKAAQQSTVFLRTGSQSGLVPQQVTESTQDRTFALAGSTG